MESTVAVRTERFVFQADVHIIGKTDKTAPMIREVWAESRTPLAGMSLWGVSLAKTDVAF